MPTFATDELRAAHDVLAEVYAERLVRHYEQTPVEQAVLGLWAGWVEPGGTVADIGSGSGRMTPHLAAFGFTPRGVDLSPEMVRVARRDFPDLAFEVGDLRELPFEDASLDGAIGWYSLMYLPPRERPAAFAELARVLRPGAPLAAAYKAGDDSHRRGGRTLDVEFDIWWMSPAEVHGRLVDAGLEPVFWAGRPAGPDEPQDQGYVIARRGSI